MNPAERTSAALAAAIGAMLEPEIDVADVLAHLVAECAAAVSADAVALLARDASNELSLLAASSHRAEQLELLQIQREMGPCVDVLRDGHSLRVAGAAEVVDRWGQVGDAIVDAGFEAVEAYPMRWRGDVLGGLNVFRADPGAGVDGVEGVEGASETAAATCQAFADVATLVVVQSGPMPEDHVLRRVHEALSARGLVEQAKGVIAYRQGVDMGEAYQVLLRRAEASGVPLTRTAREIVREAATRSR